MAQFFQKGLCFCNPSQQPPWHISGAAVLHLEHLRRRQEPTRRGCPLP